MKESGGIIKYKIYVDCPYCNLTSEVANEFDDSSLDDAVFSRAWDDIGINRICDHCGKEFILDSVEI